MNVAFTPSLGIKWDSIPTEILELRFRIGSVEFTAVDRSAGADFCRLQPAASQQTASQPACQPAPPGAAGGHRLSEDAAPLRVTYVLL